MRTGIVIFLALMIVSILGVIFPVVIEYPLEFYYHADVQHVSEHYSYKPGQSGVQFFYFRQLPFGGYVQIDLFKAIGICTVFYAAVVVVLAMIRRLIRYLMRPKTHASEPKRMLYAFLRTRVNPEKAVKYDRIIFLLLLSVFLFCGRNNVFGDHAGPRELTAFVPSHIVYMPNGSGTGNVYVVDFKTNERGAAYFKNGEPVKYDSTVIFIRALDDDKILYTLRRKGSLSSIKMFSRNELLWMISNPDMMVALDDKLTEKFGSKLDFEKTIGLETPGIHELVYMPDKRLRLNLLDGTSTYYDFKTKSLNERLRIDPNDERFKLDRLKGSQSDLTYKSVSGEQTALNDQEQIEAEILYQNQDMCVVFAAKDIREESETYLRGFDTSGSMIWQIGSGEFPKPTDNKGRVPADYEFDCTMDGDVLVIICHLQWQLAGIMAVDPVNGKIIWKKDYADL